MYFCPTVPHGSNDVATALNSSQFSCKDTANGTLGFYPWIKNMTCMEEAVNCIKNSIRSRTENRGDEYGFIWLDDLVETLLQALDD